MLGVLTKQKTFVSFVLSSGTIFYNFLLLVSFITRPCVGMFDDESMTFHVITSSKSVYFSLHTLHKTNDGIVMKLNHT